MKTFAKSGLKKFHSSCEGSAAVIVAVVLLVLIGILMVTVDLSRVQSGSTNNQSAIDASTLAAAEYVARFRINHQNQQNPSDLATYTLQNLKTNLTNDQSDAVLAGEDAPNFTVVADSSTVTVTACLNVKTGFAGALSQGGTQKVCNSSKASLPGAGNVEIVFALDVSYSMLEKYPAPDGTQVEKLAALRDSVNNLMDYYASNNNIYWGVVPYTGMVDLGANAPNIVANDLNSGEPSYELQPYDFTFNYLTDNPYHYKYYFDGVEDQYEYGAGSQFEDDNSLDSLIRIPLTSREGDAHPEDNSTITFDDAPPTAGNKFQAYWHHPFDFFVDYEDHNWPPSDANACGTCIPYNYDTQVFTAPGNPSPVDPGSYCKTPSGPPCTENCGGGPSSPPTCPTGESC